MGKSTRIDQVKSGQFATVAQNALQNRRGESEKHASIYNSNVVKSVEKAANSADAVLSFIPTVKETCKKISNLVDDKLITKLTDDVVVLAISAETLAKPAIATEKTISETIKQVSDHLGKVHVHAASLPSAKGKLSDYVYQATDFMQNTLSVFSAISNLEEASRRVHFNSWLELRFQEHAVSVLGLAKTNTRILKISENEEVKPLTLKETADFLTFFDENIPAGKSAADMYGTEFAEDVFKKLDELSGDDTIDHPLSKLLQDKNSESAELAFLQISAMHEQRRIRYIENEITLRVRCNMNASNQDFITAMLSSQLNRFPKNSVSPEFFNFLSTNPLYDNYILSDDEKKQDLEIQRACQSSLLLHQKITAGCCLRLAAYSLLLTAGILSFSMGLSVGSPVLLGIVAVAILIAAAIERFFPESIQGSKFTTKSFIQNIKKRSKNKHSIEKLSIREGELSVLQQSLSDDAPSLIPATEDKIKKDEPVIKPKPDRRLESALTGLQDKRRQTKKHAKLKKVGRCISNLTTIAQMAELTDSLGQMSQKFSNLQPAIKEVSGHCGLLGPTLENFAASCGMLINHSAELSSSTAASEKQVKETAEKIQATAGFLVHEAKDASPIQGKASDSLYRARDFVYSAMAVFSAASMLIVATDKKSNFTSWLGRTLSEHSLAVLDLYKLNILLRDNHAEYIDYGLPASELISLTDKYIQKYNKDPETLNGWQYAKQVSAFLDSMEKFSDENADKSSLSWEDRKILKKLMPLYNVISSLSVAQRKIFLLQIAGKHAERNVQNIEEKLTVRLKMNANSEDLSSILNMFSAHLPKYDAEQAKESNFIRTVLALRNGEFLSPEISEKSRETEIKEQLNQDFEQKKRRLIACSLSFVSVSIFFSIAVLSVLGAMPAAPIMIPLLLVGIAATVTVRKKFPDEQKNIQMDVREFFRDMKKSHKTSRAAEKLSARFGTEEWVELSVTVGDAKKVEPEPVFDRSDKEKLQIKLADAFYDIQVTRQQKKQKKSEKVITFISNFDPLSKAGAVMDSISDIAEKVDNATPIIDGAASHCGKLGVWFDKYAHKLSSLLNCTSGLIAPIAANSKVNSQNAEKILDVASSLSADAKKVKVNSGKSSDILTSAANTFKAGLSTASVARDYIVAIQKSRTLTGWLRHTLKERAQSLRELTKISDAMKEGTGRVFDTSSNLTTLHELANSVMSSELGLNLRQMSGWTYAEKLAGILDGLRASYRLLLSDPEQYDATVNSEEKIKINNFRAWLEITEEMDAVQQKNFLLQMAWRHTEKNIQQTESELATRLNVRVNGDNHARVVSILDKYGAIPLDADMEESRFLKTVNSVRQFNLHKASLEDKAVEQNIRLSLITDCQQKRALLTAAVLNLIYVSALFTLAILGFAGISAMPVVMPITCIAIAAALVVKKYYADEEKLLGQSTGFFWQRLKEHYKTDKAVGKLIERKKLLSDTPVIPDAAVEKMNNDVKSAREGYVTAIKEALAALQYTAKAPSEKKLASDSLASFFQPIRQNIKQNAGDRLLALCEKLSTEERTLTRNDHQDIDNIVTQIKTRAGINPADREIFELLQSRVRAVCADHGGRAMQNRI